MPNSAVVPVAVCLALISTTVLAEAPRYRPREPLPKEALPLSAIPQLPRAADSAALQYRLVVKLKDEVEGRARAGKVVSLAGSRLDRLEAVAAEHRLVFSPLLRTDPQKLRDLERRAAERTGVAAADLSSLMVAELPDATPGKLLAAGRALLALPEIEVASLQQLFPPPPADQAPPTPDHVPNQTYRGPDPGIDADYAASQGATGAGIRLADCEYGWTQTHEDLEDRNLNLEAGQTVAADVFTNGWDQHGTAVVGITSGVDNAYGVTGLAPDAEVYTYPEWTDEEGFRRTTAVTNAIADSAVGDVVLLEMQSGGAGGFAPAEFDFGVWLATKTGTDAGVIVVGAAGNGNQDLDSAPYAAYRARGHSGAILVGAGSNNTNHDKLGFSTYGSRVDVQGWGTGVFTLGYGSFASYGGDHPNQSYTATFNGTSSASPFIASAAAILQQVAVQEYGDRLSPQGMRNLLVTTGIPQGSGGNIGPFPDLRAAIDNLTGNGPPTATPESFTGTSDQNLDIPFADLLDGDSDPDSDPLTVVRWTAPGNGAICFSSDTLLVYCPNAGFVGSDSFEYVISDGVREASATVSLEIVAPVPLFVDGFESGNTSAWSATVE
ncbi:MAG: S8 family serine peptidase [Acidobacteriota bacterium]